MKKQDVIYQGLVDGFRAFCEQLPLIIISLFVVFGIGILFAIPIMLLLMPIFTFATQTISSLNAQSIVNVMQQKEFIDLIKHHWINGIPIILLLLIFLGWIQVGGTRLALDIIYKGNSSLKRLFVDINAIPQAIIGLLILFSSVIVIFSLFGNSSIVCMNSNEQCTMSSYYNIFPSFLCYLLWSRFYLWNYYIVDKQENIFQALKHSFLTTQGYFWHLVGYLIIMNAILYVSLFIFIPFEILSLAYIYRFLLAEYNKQHLEFGIK